MSSPAINFYDHPLYNSALIRFRDIMFYFIATADFNSKLSIIHQFIFGRMFDNFGVDSVLYKSNKMVQKVNSDEYPPPDKMWIEEIISDVSEEKELLYLSKGFFSIDLPISCIQDMKMNAYNSFISSEYMDLESALILVLTGQFIGFEAIQYSTCPNPEEDLNNFANYFSLILLMMMGLSEDMENLYKNETLYSGQNWNTPEVVIQCIHNIGNRITIDCFSNMTAQQNIRAVQWFNEDDYSYEEKTDFVGDILINPPYTGAFNENHFVEKLCRNSPNMKSFYIIIPCDPSTSRYKTLMGMMNSYESNHAFCFQFPQRFFPTSVRSHVILVYMEDLDKVTSLKQKIFVTLFLVAHLSIVLVKLLQ